MLIACWALLVYVLFKPEINEIPGGREVIHAEYKKQAFLGDIIYPRLARKDQTLYVLLCNAAGEPYVITEFTLERNEL